jgi:AcrR family transcriptional regulator
MELRAAPSVPGSRPRIEGDREQEVLAAALEVLAEVGYDKFSLDRVAARARAGKATLYRRWPTKADLVADAMAGLDTAPAAPPDTGTLRGDLLAMVAEREEGVLHATRTPVVCGLLTAMHRDPELSAALRGKVVDPRQECLRAVLEQARARGEIDAAVDLELITSIIPAMVVYQVGVEGRTDVSDLVTRLIDEVVLPAVQRRTG